MTIYSLDIFLSQFGTSLLFHVWFSLLLLDLQTEISQEAGKVVWYSHLLKNFPQFVVIHTVKGFSVVNEADVLLEFSDFSIIQWMLAILSLVGLPFENPG